MWILISPMMAFSLFDEETSDKEYLQLITSVKEVTIHTQQVRGLTNSFKNGNVAAQLLVYAQREKLDNDFKALELLIKKTKLDASISGDAQKLMKDIKKLNSKAFRKESATVFSAYTSVIESWMVVNGKIINTYFKKGDVKIYNALLMMNNTLLPLTENIGKLRGMGSGIVARGSCNKSETPKMQMFATNIETYRIQMQKYFKTNGCRRFSTRKLAQFNLKIEDYTVLVEEKVLGKKEIKLDANNYFDQGTGCITDIVSIYNAMAEEIGKQL